jgi:hypothetical protein
MPAAAQMRRMKERKWKTFCLSGYATHDGDLYLKKKEKWGGGFESIRKRTFLSSDANQKEIGRQKKRERRLCLSDSSLRKTGRANSTWYLLKGLYWGKRDSWRKYSISLNENIFTQSYYKGFRWIHFLGPVCWQNLVQPNWNILPLSSQKF